VVLKLHPGLRRLAVTLPDAAAVDALASSLDALLGASGRTTISA
jgi:hypothetical protein